MDSRVTFQQEGPTSQPQSLELSWLRPMGLVALSLVNFLYRLITLGIYDFWARTEVRKRLWSAIRLDGEPLTYTGTGRELFLGFLIVFGVVLLPILLATFAVMMLFGPESPAAAAVQLAIYIGVIFLVGIGVFRAQRYRLLRTNWRGIRGNLEGSSLNYGWTYFWTLALIPITLGWIIPWRTTKLQSLITGAARFGDQPFAFSGDAGPLYGPFALLWFGVMLLVLVGSFVIGGAAATIQSMAGPELLTDGGRLPRQYAHYMGLLVLSVIAVGYLFYLLMSAWYRARTINHFAQCTHFDEARFSGRLRGVGLLYIDITNLLILAGGALLLLIPTMLLLALAGALLSGLGGGLSPEALSEPTTAGAVATVATPVLFFVFALSFTLLLPVTQARSMGYLINHLALDGAVDVDRIAQSTADPLTTGEGLAQAFDVDAF